MKRVRLEEIFKAPDRGTTLRTRSAKPRSSSCVRTDFTKCFLILLRHIEQQRTFPRSIWILLERLAACVQLQKVSLTKGVVSADLFASKVPRVTEPNSFVKARSE